MPVRRAGRNGGLLRETLRVTAALDETGEWCYRVAMGKERYEERLDAALDPTAYQDVNVALRHLLMSIRAILGEHFLGMYLDGSLALGDFDPRSSDIDYLVVTNCALSDEAFSALREMHARFNAGGSPWATEVEALYVPREALRRADPAYALLPHIQRGPAETLVLDDLGGGWVLHLHVLREHGVALVGPDPRSLIDPVHPDELRWASADLMETWWGPMTDDVEPKFESHVGYRVYTAITMCRILYTLQFGTVVSKPVAARWALEALDPAWKDVIRFALAWRKDDSAPRAGGAIETTELVRYTLARCRQWTQKALPRV